MLNKLEREICEALTNLDNFKYTYSEICSFMEKLKKKTKKSRVKKEEKIKEEDKLNNYREFMNRHIENGLELQEILNLWNEHNKK